MRTYVGFYNCLLRQVEYEVLPCCRRLGMAFYCYSPLAAGLLGGNPRHSFASVMGGQAYSAGRSSDPEVLAEAVASLEKRTETLAQMQNSKEGTQTYNKNTQFQNHSSWKSLDSRGIYEVSVGRHWHLVREVFFRKLLNRAGPMSRQIGDPAEC